MTELSQNCARCNGSNLEAGDLHTAHGAAWFRLLSGPVFSLFSSKVSVRATMCLDCGDIKLTGDVTRAREVLRK